MDNLDSSFKEQQRLEDAVSLKAMIIQVSINLGFAVFVLFLFSWLRPRHDSIYASKAKLSKSDIRRPQTLGSGWFDWIKPVFKIKDDALLENIGFDAYIFIYFTRILRRLVIVLTLISMFIFLPLNIVATYTTGDWPPVGLEFMSISAMNYQYGKQSKAPNHRWYWAPTVATWLFSIIITYQMIYASKKFILFRQRYHFKREELTKMKLASMSPIELLQQQKQDLISRTLLVHYQNNNNHRKSFTRQQKSATKQAMIRNEGIKKLVDSLSTLPCQQVLIGKYNSKVTLQIKDYNRIIKTLEKTLNHYLYRLNQQRLKEGESTANPVKRPQIRLNWRSKKIDAINYYTERALLLNASIKRNRSKLQDNNYGWVIYPNKTTAQQAYLSIEKKLHGRTDNNNNNNNNNTYCESIRLAPHPDDIVWSNMNVDKKTAQLKRWFGYGLFCSVVFAWSIPVATIAIMSNVVNLIRLFPKTAQMLKDNQLIMGIIQSYLTPCLMVLFYFGLPDLLRYISRQQAYKTETVLQQKILSKLYAFFVINNLFIFTLVSIMLGIVGQITALTLVGTLRSKSLSQYIVQIAKNMTDVSSFWINYVCIRSVGALVDLLQVVPLLSILVFRRQCCFRYTPRQLDKVIGAPPNFDFATNYAVVISFFTTALVYSVTAPIVLPFALIYFGLAATTFKYKLMYINVTKVETHGRIWPMLYCIVMISLLVFQVMMILIFSLKAGMTQIYTLIPLPFMTAIILIGYTRHLYKHNTLKTWIELNNTLSRLSIAPLNSRRSSSGDSKYNSNCIELHEIAESSSNSNHRRREEEEEDPRIKDANLMNCIYRDPTLYDTLWKPMVFEEFQDLLADVYKDHSQRDRIFNILYSSSSSEETVDGSNKPKVVTNNQHNASCSSPIVIDEVAHGPSSSSPVATTTPVHEKLQVRLEMALYPPTPLHSPLHDTSFYHYYQEQQQEEEVQGSSNSSSKHHSPIHFTTSFERPCIEEEDEFIQQANSPSAPPLESLQQTPSSSSLRKEVPLSPEELEESSVNSRNFIQQLPLATAPPPNYADAVISPRINELHQLRPSQQAPPAKLKRRHST